MNLERDVADAFLEGIRAAGLPFEPGTIPHNPISVYDSVNQLWYSRNPLLGNDQLGRIVIFNQSALDFFRYGADDIFGKPSRELTKDDNSQAKIRADAIAVVLETGNPFRFENSSRIRGDGSIVNVSKWDLFRYTYKSIPSFGAFIY
jgi:PAS domain-containing protein